MPIHNSPDTTENFSAYCTVPMVSHWSVVTTICRKHFLFPETRHLAPLRAKSGKLLRTQKTFVLGTNFVARKQKIFEIFEIFEKKSQKVYRMENQLDSSVSVGRIRQSEAVEVASITLQEQSFSPPPPSLPPLCSSQFNVIC